MSGSGEVIVWGVFENLSVCRHNPKQVLKRISAAVYVTMFLTTNHYI